MRIPNLRAASGTVCMNITGEYSPRQYGVDRGRYVIYEYLITGNGPSYSREATSQSSVLARNGIVGLVILLRPAGVMMTRFRRARESRSSTWIRRVC